MTDHLDSLRSVKPWWREYVRKPEPRLEFEPVFRIERGGKVSDRTYRLSKDAIKRAEAAGFLCVEHL